MIELLFSNSCLSIAFDRKEYWKPFCALDWPCARRWCASHFDVHLMPWNSLVVQGVTRNMLPIVQVVGVPTRIACATQERGTSALEVWIHRVCFSCSNLLVSAVFQVICGSLATHCFHESTMVRIFHVAECVCA